MPTNIWHHHVPLGDVMDGYRTMGTPVEVVRDAVVARLREHPFHAAHRGDVVLRGFIEDLAKTATVEQFDQEMFYLDLWGDQEHTRVWLCKNRRCSRCQAG